MAFDLEKLKKLDVSGLVGDLKSMINPAGGTPVVDPDDDLGLKIAEITTLLTQMTEAQQAHIKQLQKINELLNIAFQDIKKLRDELHSVREKKADTVPVDTTKSAEAEKPAADASSDVEKK